jgi:hypothetical protein
MRQPLASQIRHHIQQYISGTIDFQSFESWTVSATWNIHHHNDPELETLANAVNGLLIERSGDLISEEEFVQSLTELRTQPDDVFEVLADAPPRLTSSARTFTLRLQVGTLTPVAQEQATGLHTVEVTSIGAHRP